VKVGLTYDLRQDYLAQGYKLEETAELDKAETIESIENALKNLGFETERIGHVKALVARLAEGKKWDVVFNIAEGMHGYAREAQIPSLLDAYQIPYTFSDAHMLNICLNKAVTKNLVREHGVATPDYFVVETEEDIKNVILPYPLFAKPVAEGTSKGINNASRINNAEDLESVCKNLLEKFNQPVLVETYLCGREFTVGITGTGKDAKALATLEIILNKKAEQHAYSYNNKENFEELVTYELSDCAIAEKCKELALKAWNCLNLKDAGRVDIRLNAHGEPNFIEVNPLAGLNPITSDLPIMCSKIGISFRELIGMIMESAIKRINSEK
jgi:D-alanine-D-alanine ligase